MVSGCITDILKVSSGCKSFLCICIWFVFCAIVCYWLGFAHQNIYGWRDGSDWPACVRSCAYDDGFFCFCIFTYLCFSYKLAKNFEVALAAVKKKKHIHTFRYIAGCSRKCSKFIHNRVICSNKQWRRSHHVQDYENQSDLICKVSIRKIK